MRAQEKMQGPFGPSERSRKAHGGPRGPFFQLLLSPPLRHLIQAALSARASAGPGPAPSLAVTLCKLGQGTILARGVVSPWGGSSVPGGCSRTLGGTFGRTFPGLRASGHFCAGSAELMLPALPSPLTKCVGAGKDFTAPAQCTQAKNK